MHQTRYRMHHSTPCSSQHQHRGPHQWYWRRWKKSRGRWGSWGRQASWRCFRGSRRSSLSRRRPRKRERRVAGRRRRGGWRWWRRWSLGRRSAHWSACRQRRRGRVERSFGVPMRIWMVGVSEAPRRMGLQARDRYLSKTWKTCMPKTATVQLMRAVMTMPTTIVMLPLLTADRICPAMMQLIVPYPTMMIIFSTHVIFPGQYPMKYLVTICGV